MSFYNEFTRKEKVTFLFLAGTLVALVGAIWVGFPIKYMMAVYGSEGGKGLKVYLTIDSNQRSQDAFVTTYQYGDIVSSGPNIFVNQGTSEETLTYQSGQVDEGEFRICVRLNDGVEGCGNGYNSPEKKPEYVNININRQQVLLGNNNAQSQSQSQETTIYICNDDGCRVQ
jgi:hypothetical protein